ncbi:MAG: exonuclease domain-containing protein [Lachnospirales bacterium]
MNYIIVDFEFNQSYDFKKNKKGISNKLCPCEIIQIGAIKLDKTFKEVKTDSRFNELIKPTVYPKIHPHVSKITGFTEETFLECDTFSHIAENFSKYCDTEDIFIVWGDNDIVSLFKNLNLYGLLDLPFPKNYINIQKYVSKKLRNLNGAQISLKNAVVDLKIPYNEDFHDAFNDAYYTAEIFKCVQSIPMQVNKFQMKNILHNTVVEKEIDYNNLYKSLEKDYGRKLNLKEKNIAKKVYKFGKDKFFG